MLVVLLLATDGADLNSKDTQCGRTPLSWAAENGHEAVVKLLVLLATDGVDPNSKDIEWGRTPLWWAAKNGHEAVVKLLLTARYYRRHRPEFRGHRVGVGVGGEERTQGGTSS